MKKKYKLVCSGDNPIEHKTFPSEEYAWDFLEVYVKRRIRESFPKLAYIDKDKYRFQIHEAVKNYHVELTNENT